MLLAAQQRNEKPTQAQASCLVSGLSRGMTSFFCRNVRAHGETEAEHERIGRLRGGRRWRAYGRIAVALYHGWRFSRRCTDVCRDRAGAFEPCNQALPTHQAMQA